MIGKTCATDRRLTIATLAALAIFAVPQAVRADDAPPPPPSTDQSDQSTNPTYNGGVPSTSTPTPAANPPAEPEHHKRRGLVLGINGGLFTPTSGKARDRFGNTWWSAGIGIGSIPKVTGHGSWDLDLRTQYQTGDNDAHVFVGNLGLEYRRGFDTSASAGQKDYAPFYGVSADAVFVDVSSPLDNVHGGLRIVPGASVFIGTNIGRQEFVTLRYDGIADVKGFNFSGVELAAGVRFF